MCDFTKVFTIQSMKNRFFFLTCLSLICVDALAATEYRQRTFNTITSHNDVYPYVLNNAKQNTNNSTVSGTVSNATTGKRNVVQRKTNARVATTNSYAPATSAKTTNTPARRVVQRSGTTARSATNTGSNLNRMNNTQKVSARSTTTPLAARALANRSSVTTTTSFSNEKVSSGRCFAEYKSCMEDYCKREDTAYNRCYCSAKLSQIDAKYQNKIDELIQQIVRLQYNVSADNDEIKEYWDSTIGSYTNDNPWVNIDNALNIEWADMQSRVRGQNAFNTGHQYCVQHLRACYYMASNMRDAYKSEIARDCETYEKSLQKIQAAAESVIGSYNHD